MRKFLLIVSLVVVFLGLSYFSYFLVIGELLRPPLARGLPSEIAVARVEFKERVQESFSAKTSNEEITQELISQGFDVNREKNQQVTAYYQESSVACNIEYYITWEIDKQGYIFDLDARRATACL